MIYSKPIEWKVSNIEVWFNDQNSKPLELEDKTNIILVINSSVTCKKWCVIQLNLKIKNLCKVMDFEFWWKMEKNIGKNISTNLSSKYS